MLSIPPLELARQLTLIEWEAYKNFNDRDVFYFGTNETVTKAKTLLRLGNQCQYLTYLVNREFVKLTNNAKRLEFVKYMWQVAMVIFFEIFHNSGAGKS